MKVIVWAVVILGVAMTLFPYPFIDLAIWLGVLR